ncbi:hypothetical protein Q4E93_19790 [Flavitalea sp. BT771]|uniref:hypothetical protein n=1 Tax=Flavitalea sp. BT771 TaxID=3063329 RepID=UPI0026E2C9CF|nr:hypothetical protein [Flavitalea sp. BT771]MDO6432860.1 hypothetical protein [Flavitalea sp. BT771]MDV6221864.1 hypothetical protein [Flavitalea sp. BT771]
MHLLLIGLLAGTLDAIAAVLLFLAGGNKDPRMLFRYIASAVYGKRAFAGEGFMPFMGLLFHFLIAISWVAVYFFLHTHIPWLDSHPLFAAVIFGSLVWIIMNLIIVPYSKATPRPFSWLFVVINVVILIMAIGLPAAYLSI